MKQIAFTAKALFLILFCLTAYGQESSATFRTAYESALLDSAYRYEALKPAYKNLNSAYEYRGREIESLQMQIMQCELQAKETAKAEKKRRRRAFWNGVKTGVAGAIIAGIAILLS